LLIMADPLPSRQHQLQRCLQKLGLPPGTKVDWHPLDVALTHGSMDPVNHYEQLELLGDAVLRLAATECLQDYIPEATVGELSSLRAVLTSDRTLAQLAEQLGLETYLLVSDSVREDVLGRPSRLADAFEAVLAALYQETHNLSLIRPWLDPHLRRWADTLRQDPARQNYKALLQELTQAEAKALPTYQTEERCPIDGDPERFRSAVWFWETCWGRGTGPTKKQAEQAAAKAAYLPLQQHFGLAPVSQS
jgi:ribonuclease-3